MKKIVASVGLVALGASTLTTASAQSLDSTDNSKPWNISAVLRGFYDDNTGTIPDASSVPDGRTRSSWGYEVSPSIALKWVLEQTTINLGYLYSLKYYQDTPPNSFDHDDQVHTFNLGLTHNFNERVKANVSDSFVIGQEPDLLRAGATMSTFQRASGNNIRNYGVLGLDAEITPKFGLGAGYDNAYYQYDNTGAGVSGNTVVASTAGTLDRMENGAHLEGLYSLAPETKGLFGYRFRSTSYTADEYIGGTVINPAGSIDSANLQNAVFSSDRNAYQHTMYLGAEHNFRPDLTAALRAGASYVDYHNDPQGDSSWAPYVTGTLKYTYAQESHVDIGLSYDRNAVDVVGAEANGDFTRDAQSVVFYASLNHRITPKLFASLLGQIQNSSYDGGSYDSSNETYYMVGFNMEYRFNQFLSAQVGYNYDYLDSEIGRTYDRNRVYLGFTASY
jgi:hypothetical protein